MYTEYVYGSSEFFKKNRFFPNSAMKQKNFLIDEPNSLCSRETKHWPARMGHDQAVSGIFSAALVAGGYRSVKCRPGIREMGRMVYGRHCACRNIPRMTIETDIRIKVR